MNSTTPKILILGQPFNNSSGGGITLTNLFKGWPKDRIAVAATGNIMYNVTTDVCNTCYMLGDLEHKWTFPFNLVQKSYKSGLLSFGAEIKPPSAPGKKGIRYKLVNQLFYPFLRWTGLFHCTSALVLSQNFIEWLRVYKPEILYLQLASREDILFATKLIGFLNIPSAIHMMDDWPSTISSKGPFKGFWSRKIDREFKYLLGNIDIHLSISDAMSAEYFKRYQKHFHVFHNPIDVSKYDQEMKNESVIENRFRVLYIGRIGVANKISISSFAKAISQFQDVRYKLEFDIYTQDIETQDISLLGNYKNVRVLPPVNHDLIPSLVTAYDLLLLPLDFTEEGLKFAQYSIPTKASEYMISGTPILVFAPGETAISRFCSSHNCGYCLTGNSMNDISEAIAFLMNNAEYRKEISSNAVRLAKERFDAEKVRKEFQSLLLSISKG